MIRSLEVYGNALAGRVHDEEFRSVVALAGSNIRLIGDIGANLGQSVVSLSKLFPGARIQSFEPNPACLKVLTNVARLVRAEVEIRPCGLGAAATLLPFYVPVVGSSELLQEGSFDRSVFSETVTIARIGRPFALREMIISIRTLDEFDDEYDLLKIDVQGLELAVLKGAANILARRKPMILIERDAREDREVEAYLSSFGYRNVTPGGIATNRVFSAN